MDKTKVKNVIKNILNLLDLDKDQYKIITETDDQIVVNINIPEDKTGYFIGRHGETINSLRLLLSLIISQRTNQWPKLRLNINDYQEKRLKFLHQLAEEAAQKANELQREIILPNLSSYERRLVHLHIDSLKNVVTESRGQEPQRQLVIIPKTS